MVERDKEFAQVADAWKEALLGLVTHFLEVSDGDVILPGTQVPDIVTLGVQCGVSHLGIRNILGEDWTEYLFGVSGDVMPQGMPESYRTSIPRELAMLPELLRSNPHLPQGTWRELVGLKYPLFN